MAQQDGANKPNKENGTDGVKLRTSIQVAQDQISHFEQLLHSSYKRKGILEKQLTPLQQEFNTIKDNIERLEGAIASLGDFIKAEQDEEKLRAKAKK